MANVLYRVVAKKKAGNLPAGSWVEIIKTTGQSRPNAKEITEAFEAKYGIRIPNGMASPTYFSITK